MPIVKHNLDRYLSLGMTWNLASHWKFWCFDVNWIRGEWKGWKLLGVKPRRLTCAASALPQSYENRTTNNSHIPSICTAQVGLKCLSCTSDSHSVCTVRTLLRSWPENSLNQDKTHNLYSHIVFSYCLITHQKICNSYSTGARDLWQ